MIDLQNCAVNQVINSKYMYFCSQLVLQLLLLGYCGQNNKNGNINAIFVAKANTLDVQ